MCVAVILLLLDIAFVLPTLSCLAAWRWVPFEKTHHWYQAEKTDSSQPSASSVDVNHYFPQKEQRLVSPLICAEQWYCENVSRVSQFLCYYYAVRRLSLNYMNYADLCRERDFMRTVFLYTVEWGYFQDTALGGLGKTWGILGGNDWGHFPVIQHCTYIHN